MKKFLSLLFVAMMIALASCETAKDEEGGSYNESLPFSINDTRIYMFTYNYYYDEEMKLQSQSEFQLPSGLYQFQVTNYDLVFIKNKKIYANLEYNELYKSTEVSEFKTEWQMFYKYEMSLAGMNSDFMNLFYNVLDSSKIEKNLSQNNSKYQININNILYDFILRENSIRLEWIEGTTKYWDVPYDFVEVEDLSSNINNYIDTL